jgi:hypothetical protein
MRYRYLLLFIATIVLFSCKKEKGAIFQQSPPPPPPPPDATVPAVLLKDIVIPNLPSPYYHFEYNSDSTISVAAFASDFKKYKVDYTGGRISEMKNNIAGLDERLQYFYDNAGRIIGVNYFDLAGAVSAKVSLTYDGQKLIKLERRRILGAGFVLNKTMTFSYYNDGNLKEIIDHRPAVNGAQDESTTSDRFAQYDNKINVDGFSLIHNDFFDHLVLLPGVQFQKNNPGEEIFTAGENSYQINYTYTYNDKNCPLTKNGDAIFTTGATAGQRFQTSASFSYY